MSSNHIEATKSLLRSAVRTFHPVPKAIFLFDALLTYNVLHLDDMGPLFPNSQVQGKEIRALLNPLKNSRLISMGQRTEIKEGHSRSAQREYYYVNYHLAVDAIKYRMVKLQEKVQELYTLKEAQQKDWSCPRCHAEYDELSILDKVGADGFYCERCGATLIQNEDAVRERGEHTKIRLLNGQLEPFNKLIAIIDAGEVPENAFEDAWQRKRLVPVGNQLLGVQNKARWYDVSQQKHQEQRKQQATVHANEMAVEISTEREQAERAAAEKKEAQRAAAVANTLPSWHSHSTVENAVNAVKKEEHGASPMPGVKKEEREEKKPNLNGVKIEEKDMQDDLDDYVREMERERLEQEQREAQKEAEDDEDDEDDEFEDAIPSDVGTPMSSQQPSIKHEITPVKINGNGVKRERDFDGDSVSGTDTGANTPAYGHNTSAFDAKRVKLENGGFIPRTSGGQSNEMTNGTAAGADSEEDDDFEDV